MKELKEKLLLFKRKTISLKELQKLAPKNETYEQFASKILTLEKENILQMVKSQGRLSRTPSLAFRYRIRKKPLNEAYYDELQTYRRKFHNAISLDAYFKLDQKTWEADLPYIKKINDYIKNNGFPKKHVPAPERSFEIVGDEKWIEQRGENLLYRINLWDKLNVMPVADPLMFALNPKRLNEPVANHLIVENKTTYQALLPVVKNSSFTTLIYGSGNKIVKSIENLHNQIPLQVKYCIYYFGDIDREGINIWHRLNQKEKVIPALPFYQACLKKLPAEGKTNQRKNETAIRCFITQFPEADAELIKQLLEKGAYYPQEVLKTAELQHILLTADWESSP